LRNHLVFFDEIKSAGLCIISEKNGIGIVFDEYNQAIRKTCAECHVELVDLA